MVRGLPVGKHSYSCPIPASFCLALLILCACLPQSGERAVPDPCSYKLPGALTLKDS